MYEKKFLYPKMIQIRQRTQSQRCQTDMISKKKKIIITQYLRKLLKNCNKFKRSFH